MLAWTVCIGCLVVPVPEKGPTTQERQAFPASAGGPSPHGSPRRHPWDVALLEGWSWHGEGLHVYQSLPIASVSAILTDR